MFVVCPKPYANCFRVVRRSIFDRRELCIAPEGRLCRGMALVSAGTTHVLTSRRQRSACQFAVLVDNKVQSHLKQPGRRSNRHRN